MVIDEWAKTQELNLTTSGSTGKPKDIHLTFNQIKASILQTQSYFNLDEKTIGFCCISVDFIAGKLMLLRGYELGFEVWITEPSSSPFESLNDNEFNLALSIPNTFFFAFVPLQLEEILSDERAVQLLNQAKSIMIGGAKLNEALLEKIQKLQSPIFATYGMTETVTHIAVRRLNGRNKTKFFSCLKGIKIKRNREKCLCIKGKTTNNQWLVTNDIVEISQTSSFRILGRKDDIINSGGIKIELFEMDKLIDEFLKKNNFQFSFFSYGIEDERLGQKFVIFVEGKNNEKIISNIQTIFSLIPSVKKPKEIRFIPKFITTNSGKIDKIKTSHATFKN